MDPDYLAIGDTVAQSPVGPGTVTSITSVGYPRVNEKEVTWVVRTDGVVYDPLGHRGKDLPPPDHSKTLGDAEWVRRHTAQLRSMFPFEMTKMDTAFFMQMGHRLRAMGVDWVCESELPTLMTQFKNLGMLQLFRKDGHIFIQRKDGWNELIETHMAVEFNDRAEPTDEVKDYTRTLFSRLFR